MEELERTFKRKMYDTLLTWKRERDGRTAVLIEGARRIGKSTLVEEFAKNEYESYILIDFTKASKEVFNLFNDISDLDYLFMRLQLIYNVELHERKSVIIFDEVQQQPLARQAIKHLVKDHRYDYIETGSLISIKKKTEGIVVPSEETRYSMYPMDYEEFRWAMGDTATVPLLKRMFDSRKPLGEAHRKLMRDLRLYMLVGGMPQAVNEYLSTNNLQKVDAVKREILALYETDLMKLDPRGRLSVLFNAIPAQLEKNASRYQITNVSENAKNDDYAPLIGLLKQSKAALVSYHCDDPNVGLARTEDLNKYKIYVCDTGLFVTLAFKDKDFTENVIYNKLLADKLSVSLGYVYENLIAQMLTALGDELFYHTFPTESGKHYYEVDFLLSRHNKLCPVEVKSSGYKSHKSLDVFCGKFSDRILNKYLMYTKDYKRVEDLTCLPAYMTMFL